FGPRFVSRFAAPTVSMFTAFLRCNKADYSRESERCAERRGDPRRREPRAARQPILVHDCTRRYWLKRHLHRHGAVRRRPVAELPMGVAAPAPHVGAVTAQEKSAPAAIATTPDVSPGTSSAVPESDTADGHSKADTGGTPNYTEVRRQVDSQVEIP